MKVIVFDIETVALPEEKMPPFGPENVALGNTKDPEKVATKILEARLERITKGALNPETGQVAMVGFMTGEEFDIRAGEEKTLVEGALRTIWEAIMAGDIVAGFRCHEFDLRFLVRRAWVNGIRVLPIREGRYWNRAIIDLHDIWLLGDRSPAKGTTTLDAIAAQLGFPPKLGKGEDFYKMSPEERVEYLKRDLLITKLLYERIT